MCVYIHVNFICDMNLFAFLATLYLRVCLCTYPDLPVCQTGVNMVYLRECAATS